MVLAAGVPGAGKTTLLTWVARRVGAVLVSRDEIRRVLFPHCEYTSEEKRSAYESMKLGLAVNLDLGRSAFPDGICFTSRTEVDEVLELGRQHGAVVALIRCSCSLALAKTRVERDRANLDWVPADRDAALVDEVARRFEALPAEALTVDTGRPVAEAGELVLQELLRLGWSEK